MQLSKNFTLAELTRSMTAERFGIDNTPTPEAVESLKLLCEKVLQPVRDNFGVTIVRSGYRSPLVNARIGGSKTSQHKLGQAADFEVSGVSNLEIAAWIAQNLEFDQLILEGHNPSLKNSGWVHCSVKLSDNRREQITATFNNGGVVYAHVNLGALYAQNRTKIV